MFRGYVCIPVTCDRDQDKLLQELCIDHVAGSYSSLRVAPFGSAFAIPPRLEATTPIPPQIRIDLNKLSSPDPSGVCGSVVLA